MANVLITGCGSGFGLLTAEKFARAGHRVFATVRDVGRAGELEAARDAERLPMTILPLDVRDAAAVRAAATTALAAGPLDVLLNNAATRCWGRWRRSARRRCWASWRPMCSGWFG